MLIISNQPCASRLSDLEITYAITPWIVLHSVQLLLLTILIIPIAKFSVLIGFPHAYLWCNWLACNQIDAQLWLSSIVLILLPDTYTIYRLIMLSFFNFSVHYKIDGMYHLLFPLFRDSQRFPKFKICSWYESISMKACLFKIGRISFMLLAFQF